MAVLAARRVEDNFGLRPMDPIRDLGGVADLIEEAFAQDLDRSGQNALQELRWLSRLKPVLWWMVYTSPDHTDFLSGFVWEEKDRIVGNVTVNRASTSSRRWLISNLAVAKDYRRQGIAWGLMYASLALVKEHNGDSVSLQVRADNQAAKQLYQSLDFREITGATYLQARRVPQVDRFTLPTRLNLRSQKFDGQDARNAYNLAQVATPFEVQREWPVRQSRFRVHVSDRLTNFFRRFLGAGPPAYWVVEDGHRMVALLKIIPGPWRQPHKLDLIVHPDWRGYLEKPLLSRAFTYLAAWPNRPIFVKHPIEHQKAIDAYKAFGLIESQTLIWMKKEM